MALKDEIFKPQVTILPIDDSGTEKPENCIFYVVVKFRPVNGVIPYPDLEYPSEQRQISKAQANSLWIISKLEDAILKHKRKYDFIREKQLVVNNFLTTQWGE